MERRLAAILAADIVGYSSLMGANESGTLAALRKLRAELFDPLIESHKGRIIKLMGDGTLVEFASVVDAVNCAAKVQKALATRNRDMPEDQQLLLRIGINLGDVMVEDEDLYGDGVNVAARLEGIAEPGGICVSRAVADQARGKVEAKFEDLGSQTLKNIAEPVEVFRVTDREVTQQPFDHLKRPLALKAISVALIAILVIGAGYWAWESNFGGTPVPDSQEVLNDPSIAVLPFEDISESPQEWLGDGMAEDIITDLSKISGLFVIARNSSFRYRGGNADLRTVGAALGVTHLLEGSVRRADNKLRINAQLIDARTGGHVWAERYDGLTDDVFALQDRITSAIVKQLSVALTPTEAAAISSPRAASVEAHDAYLRALNHMYKRTRADFAEAKKWLTRALELDPDNANALGANALLHYDAGRLGWRDAVGDNDPRPVNFIIKQVYRALKEPSAMAYLVAGRRHLTKPNAEKAIAAIERGLKLSPNDAGLIALKATAVSANGEYETAISLIEQAIEREPKTPALFLQYAGMIHHAAGHDELALDFLSRSLDYNPDDWETNLYRAAVLSDLGRIDEAKADLAIVQDRWPTRQLWQFMAPVLARYGTQRSNLDFKERRLAAYLRAGVPEVPVGFDLRPEHRLDKKQFLEIFGTTNRTSGEIGGGYWVADVTADGRRIVTYKGKLMLVGYQELRDDGSVVFLRDEQFMNDAVCDVYLNPSGSNETFDAYIWACDHGLYPSALLPMEE